MFEEEFLQPEKEYPQTLATPPPLPESEKEACSEPFFTEDDEGADGFSFSDDNEEGAADEGPRRGPGAPLGNQNARKHGFYSRKVSRKEQASLEEASQVYGLGQEIALLRARIKTIQRTRPDEHELLLKAMAALTRMVRSRGGI